MIPTYLICGVWIKTLNIVSVSKVDNDYFIGSSLIGTGSTVDTKGGFLHL